MPKIKNMYKNVLSIDFPENIASIHQAIAIRHDIVHRNGKTKSGKTHKISEQNIKNLLSDVEHFIKYINQHLPSRKSVG